MQACLGGKCKNVGARMEWVHTVKRGRVVDK